MTAYHTDGGRLKYGYHQHVQRTDSKPVCAGCIHNPKLHVRNFHVYPRAECHTGKAACDDFRPRSDVDLSEYENVL